MILVVPMEYVSLMLGHRGLRGYHLRLPIQGQGQLEYFPQLL